MDRVRLAEPTGAELRQMREAGMSRRQIAAHYGVTDQKVKSWLRRYGIPASGAPLEANRNASRVSETQKAMDLDGHALSDLEKARQILGLRVGEDYRGFLLDGTPVMVDVLLKAAGIEPPK